MWVQHIARSSVFIYLPVGLLAGEFNPFPFKVVADKEGFVSAPLLFVSYVTCSFLFLFPISLV